MPTSMCAAPTGKGGKLQDCDAVYLAHEIALTVDTIVTHRVGAGLYLLRLTPLRGHLDGFTVTEKRWRFFVWIVSTRS